MLRARSHTAGSDTLHSGRPNVLGQVPTKQVRSLHVTNHDSRQWNSTHDHLAKTPQSWLDVVHRELCRIHALRRVIHLLLLLANRRERLRQGIQEILLDDSPSGFTHKLGGLFLNGMLGGGVLEDVDTLLVLFDGLDKYVKHCIKFEEHIQA